MTETLKRKPRGQFAASTMRNKIMLSYILLVLSTTSIMLGITYMNAYDLAWKRAQDQMSFPAKSIAQQVNAEVKRDVEVTQHIAREEATRSEAAAMNGTPARENNGATNLSEVYLFDKTGALTHPLRGGTAPRYPRLLPQDPGFRMAKRNRKTVVFIAAPTTGTPNGFFVAVPVIGADDRYAGMVVGEILFENSPIGRLIREERHGSEELDIYLVDAEGRALASSRDRIPRKSLFDNGMLLSDLREPKTPNADLMRRLPSEIDKFKYRREKRTGVSTLVSPMLRWYIVISQPMSVALESVRDVSLKIILVAIVAMLWAVGLALYRSHRIIQPIRELASAVDVIARGDYSKRVQVTSRDEIGAFAYAFNKMTSVLQGKIRDLQESQTQLEEAFNQLKNDTRKREETTQELARKVNELTSLSEMTQLITDSINRETVLDAIVETIGRVMGFDTCSIKLLDRKSGHLHVTVSRGLGEEYDRKGRTPFGEGVSGIAIKMLHPIVVKDLESDPRIEQDHVLTKLGVKSFVSFPLVTKKNPVGVMNLYTREEHDFTEDELRLLSIFANQAASAIENARLFDELKESYMNTIQALSMAIDAKDPYTHGHSKRVSDIAQLVGRQMGLTPERLDLLKHAGDLHDIGKIGITEEIIRKKTKLSVEEYELIKTHPLVGEVIIEPVPFLKDARAVIRHHHERWDGFGYPDGLKDEEIPLLSRIILIADAYDAMTSDRPYRKALTHETAVREIERHANAQFDPKVVKAFIELLRDCTPEEYIRRTQAEEKAAAAEAE